MASQSNYPFRQQDLAFFHGLWVMKLMTEKLREYFEAEWEARHSGEKWNGSDLEREELMAIMKKWIQSGVLDRETLKSVSKWEIERWKDQSMALIFHAYLNATPTSAAGLKVARDIGIRMQQVTVTLFQALQKGLTPQTFKTFLDGSKAEFVALGLSWDSILAILKREDFSPNTSADSEKDDLQVLKAQGNEFFKQEKFSEAVEMYTKALNVPNLSDDMRAILYSNRSASHQGMQEYRLAKRDADRAQRIYPGWWKPMFWLVRAYNCLEHFSKTMPFANMITYWSPDAWKAAARKEYKIAMAGVQKIARADQTAPSSKPNIGPKADAKAWAPDSAYGLKPTTSSSHSADSTLKSSPLVQMKPEDKVKATVALAGESKTAYKVAYAYTVSGRAAMGYIHGKLSLKDTVEQLADAMKHGDDAFVQMPGLMFQELTKPEWLQSHRKHYDTYLLLIGAYSANPREALQVVDQALAIFPDDALLLRRRGSLTGFTGDWKLALKYITKGVSLYPDDIELMRFKVMLSWEHIMRHPTERIDPQVLTDLLTFIQTADIDHPHVPQAHFDLSHLYLMEKQPELSRQFYDAGYEMMEKLLPVHTPFECKSKSILDEHYRSSSKKKK